MQSGFKTNRFQPPQTQARSKPGFFTASSQPINAKPTAKQVEGLALLIGNPLHCKAL